MRTALRWLALAAGGVSLLWCTASVAADSCREWRDEHAHWKAETVHRVLSGAPQHELDSAVFELLQREAYLTSCEVSVQGGRADLVGWRLLGRSPDQYGSAVLESLLERGGFDLDLRHLFAAAPPARTPQPGPRADRHAAR
jgi:hypothetical protein